MKYLPRSLDRELDDLLPHLSAVAIDGPKGVGKTATAQRRADTVLSLDRTSNVALLESDFDFDSFRGKKLLLDEWQYYPKVWDMVRRAVDQGAPAGSFLLTGSASPYDMAGSHSGAGRVVSLRMRPMGLHERGQTTPTVFLSDLLAGEADISTYRSEYKLADYMEAIVASGFPGLAGFNPRALRAQLEGYLMRVIDRDIPELGAEVRHPLALRKWLAAYAAAESSTTAYSKLLDATTGGDGTQPSEKTTRTYREHLAKLWLLDPVPGWVPALNAFTRLQQSPKHHLADPALAAHLLGLDASALLSDRGSHMAGPLFESLVTLTVRVMAQSLEATVSHLRMNSGAREIDLLVEGHDGQLVAIEVKLKAVPTDRDVRHLLWLKEQLPQRVASLVVITAGDVAYRRPDGVYVIPLALLG
ncbi:ATP-binding protein [Rothia sp. P5764]|uniref:ATP-binding protein n=1 Tax=Rothia sp. P5764 TaxID=3402654 RepID=UPI003AD01737